MEKVNRQYSRTRKLIKKNVKQVVAAVIYLMPKEIYLLLVLSLLLSRLRSAQLKTMKEAESLLEAVNKHRKKFGKKKSELINKCYEKIKKIMNRVINYLF